MDLPTRIIQHKSQSDSFAILLYKLKDLGIFRNITENDYGIDFEIELTRQVSDSEYKVTGEFIKAQIKSSKNLYFRKDGTPTIGGINQSTLYYWSELSYRTNVLIYAVDLSNENIYVSRPIFWQAIKLLDESGSSKTIELIPIDVDHINKVSEYTKIFSSSPSVPTIFNYHKFALSNLGDFLGGYSSAASSDFFLEIEDRLKFQTILETCSILLHDQPFETKGLSSTEIANIFDYQFWDTYSKHDKDLGGVSNRTACKPLSVVVPALLNYLHNTRENMIVCKYYWLNKNPEYLRYVCNHPIKILDTPLDCEKWAMEIYHNNGFHENLFDEIAYS